LILLALGATKLGIAVRSFIDLIALGIAVNGDRLSGVKRGWSAS